jgi:site-specific DNA-methyltransferase (adenine-specific)
MEFMKSLPNKCYDLAIVDPPYGINIANAKTIGKCGKKYSITNYISKKWDSETPKAEYFKELFRVSKNQIIWGANHYPNFLIPSSGWIFWDKGQRDFSFSDGELAFTSYGCKLKAITIHRSSLHKENRFHPTQKPISLYQWIYTNYLPQGGKVLDTHLGSGSNRIAADKMGNIDFVGCELDKDYFEAQEKRFADYKKQLKLFA